MSKIWRKAAATVLSALVLIWTAQLVVFAEDAALVSSGTADYQLTDTIKANIKSVLNERTSEGVRMGVVVRLYNLGSQIARVPEFEVKVKTNDGIEYSLNPSSVNVRAIQPKEKVELSYMMTVNREDAFSLSELNWVDVNDTLYYPKKEKTILSIPISSLEWNGEGTDLSKTAANRYWGMPFTVPVLSPTLQFKPVQYFQQNTPQGPAAIITLLVENKGLKKQVISDFRMEGNSNMKVYVGKRLEAGNITLGTGESQYIHYAIPIENNVVLNNVNVMTTDNYMPDEKTSINYSIGWIQIQLPAASNGQNLPGRVDNYDPNKPITFDPLNKLISPDIDVYLVDLHMLYGEDDSYKAVVASFRLQNKGTIPAAVPNIMAELVNEKGISYTGTRQNGVVQSMIPNINYLVNYTFIVPNSETGNPLTMELLDGESTAPYQVPIASFRTQVQNVDNQLSIYPFNVKLNSWVIDSSATKVDEKTTYKYNLRMNMDITREDKVIVGQNISKMKMELVNDRNELLSSQIFTFTGENRLGSGDRTITFTADKYVYPFIVNIYESIDTPYGESRRLLKTLRQ